MSVRKMVEKSLKEDKVLKLALECYGLHSTEYLKEKLIEDICTEYYFSPATTVSEFLQLKLNK